MAKDLPGLGDTRFDSRAEKFVVVRWQVKLGAERVEHLARRSRTSVPIREGSRKLTDHLVAEMLARSCEGKRREQLIFGGGDAHMRRPNAENGWFPRAVVAAQEEDLEFPRITPHDLRHTAASIAISAGANPKAVQRMLGHASPAMTLDTYADLFEDALDAVSERMDAVRAETVVGVSWGVGG